MVYLESYLPSTRGVTIFGDIQQVVSQPGVGRVVMDAAATVELRRVWHQVSTLLRRVGGQGRGPVLQHQHSAVSSGAGAPLISVA